MADRFRTVSLLDEVSETCGRNALPLLVLRLLLVRKRFRRRRPTGDPGPELRWPGKEEVEVDAEQAVRREASHGLADDRPYIATLCDVARVTQPLHQDVPGLRDAHRVPTGSRWLAR